MLAVPQARLERHQAMILSRRSRETYLPLSAESETSPDPVPGINRLVICCEQAAAGRWHPRLFADRDHPPPTRKRRDARRRSGRTARRSCRERPPAPARHPRTRDDEVECAHASARGCARRQQAGRVRVSCALVRVRFSGLPWTSADVGGITGAKENPARTGFPSLRPGGFEPPTRGLEVRCSVP